MERVGQFRRRQPELPRRLIGTIIPELDAIADDHGSNTVIGRSAVLPIFIRVRILALPAR
jgi:hypothetical protein